MEVSPYNPDARRAEGGCWNEHVLPVLDWEMAEQRVVIPADLQSVLGIDTPVLRWRRSKYEQVAKEHAQPIERRVLSDLSDYLNRWERAGLEPGKSQTWRVFFRIATCWVMMVFGKDQEGSMNVVTLYSPSDRNYLANMIARGTYRHRKLQAQEK